MDSFKPRELEGIADLMRKIEVFNKDQLGDRPLFAEVTFYRDGNDVAALTDVLVFESDGSKGELRFEVKP